jgi:hypothetical protein
VLLDFEASSSELADSSTFREMHIIWTFLALNLLYVMSILYLIRIDRTSNNGNVEYAKLKDVKEGYKTLERRTTGDTMQIKAAGSLQRWRVRVYIFLVALVLAFTWISFGVALGYRRS